MPSIDEFQSHINGLREGKKNSFNLSRASINNLLKENLFYVSGYVIGLQDTVYQAIWLDILQGWNEALKDIKNNQLPPPAELGNQKNYSPAKTLGYLRCCGVSYSVHPHYQEQLQTLALQTSQSALPIEISAPLLIHPTAPILDTTAESTSLNQENVELLLAGHSDAKSHNQPLPLSQLFDGRSCYYIQGYISGLSNIKYNRIWELYLCGWISAANDIAAGQLKDLQLLYSRKTEDNISYILGYYDYRGFSVNDSKYRQLLIDLNSQQTVYGQGMRAAMQWSTISFRPVIPPASAILSTASSSHTPATSIITAALADASETSSVSTVKRKISKDMKADAQPRAGNEKLIQKRKKILSDIAIPQFITEEMGILFLQRCDTARVRVYEDLHGKKIDVSSTPLKSKKSIHDLDWELKKELHDLERSQDLTEKQFSSRKNKLSLKIIASLAYYLAYHGRNYRGDTLSGTEILSMISMKCEEQNINSLQELIQHIAAGNLPCFYIAESAEIQSVQEATGLIQPMTASATNETSPPPPAAARDKVSEIRRQGAHPKASQHLVFVDAQLGLKRRLENVTRKLKAIHDDIGLPQFISEEMAGLFLQRAHSGRQSAYNDKNSGKQIDTGRMPLKNSKAIHELASKLNNDPSNPVHQDIMDDLAFYLGYQAKSIYGEKLTASAILSIISRECQEKNINSVPELIKHIAAGNIPCFYKAESPEKQPAQETNVPIQPMSPPASSCSSTSSSSYKRLASALNYAPGASSDPTKKRKTSADTDTKALRSLLFIDGQAAANRTSENAIKKRKEALEGIILPPFINQAMAMEFLEKFNSGRTRAYDAIRGAEKPETGIKPGWRRLWKANAIHDLAAELNKKLEDLKLEDLYDSSLDYFTEKDFPSRQNDLLTESMRRLAYYLGYHGRNDHGKPFGNSEIISILVRECKTEKIESVQALIRHVAAGRMPSFYKAEPIEKAPEPEKEHLQNLMAP
ncbi:hypothetical protein B1207_15510 [Legionella quinlivanii]|uniref:Uncharacterized protein n=1 Tax=Legionella quinlivanii TaxID=45073 RepID=A0A364LF56_9GAMM|nr:hypothetical protein [Legionella quinlivanii]RAP34529.1 hypothetical protein B1207_15510 [Legionella quinlivanii]